jgi:xanthine dehydrogenase YagS FAD-binding subunit
MRSITNANASDLQNAVLLAQEARRDGRVVAFSSGGSDLLQQVKDGVVQPDLLVSLRTVAGLSEVTATSGGTSIGGLITLDALSRNPEIRERYRVLAEAAESVATPQIRNVGTLAGNVCQRPWCWYYRNGFPCFKAGGNRCFSPAGENQLHAIFGGGPSFIVHPSDLAPALVALGATFRVVGPQGERNIASEDFFILPSENPARGNVLADEDVLAGVVLPPADPGATSTFQKVMDREAWTHAVASVAVLLEWDQDVVTSARIVLGGVAPIPWRVPEAEGLLVGQRISPELARRVGQAAVAGARPLSRNGYKVRLTSGLVERTLSNLAA